MRLGAQRGLVRPFLEYVANLRVGLGGSVVTAGERDVLFDDVATSAALAGSADREALLLAEVRALHAIPLRTPDGRVVGVLSVLHRGAARSAAAGARSHGSRRLIGRRFVRQPPSRTRKRATERAPAPSDADVAARLRETQELFSNTVENLPVSMVLCDRAGRVLYVDPALGEMVRALCGLSRRRARRQARRRDMAALRLGPARGQHAQGGRDGPAPDLRARVHGAERQRQLPPLDRPAARRGRRTGPPRARHQPRRHGRKAPPRRGARGRSQKERVHRRALARAAQPALRHPLGPLRARAGRRCAEGRRAAASSIARCATSCTSSTTSSTSRASPRTRSSSSGNWST